MSCLSTRRVSLAALLIASCATGCSDDNQPPVLAPVVDQRAFVNVEMVLALSAADAEGDAISFAFETASDSITV